MKITFLMADPEPKKHSTKFDFSGFEAGAPTLPDPIVNGLKRASFYIPKPIADGAKKIRVTIEVVD